jgi:hypothetical protein
MGQHVSLVTNAEDKNDKLISKLQFEEKRRLVFDDKESLALKSLEEGIVDFADRRVQIKGASLMEQKSLGGNNNQQELFEVELGELKSLKENQIHIDEL